MTEDLGGTAIREQDIRSSRLIAGVRPIHISDNPKNRVVEERTQAQSMRRLLESKQAGRLKTPHLEKNAARGENDPRMASLMLAVFKEESGYEVPSQHFLLNESFVRLIEQASAEKGDDLSQDELLHLALQNTDGAVWPHFSPGAQNDINASYFASPIAFSYESGLSRMFIINKPINRAIGGLLRTTFDKDTIRVKELSSGARAESWPYIAEGVGAGQKLEVALTDFSTPDLPQDLSLPKNLVLTPGQQNLFEPFPKLEDKERFDAVIATYGFDSVWLPEDIRLTRIGDTWYRHLYRVKVADWHPRREELLQAMRERKPLQDAALEDYEGIFVETAVEEFDVASHPFGNYFEEAFGEKRTKRIMTIPGGLIRTVVDVFDSQLSDSGIMIIGDTTAKLGKERLMGSYISGIAARYKQDNYDIAKKILEDEYGFEVELLSLATFTKRYVGSDWAEGATANEIANLEEVRESKLPDGTILQREANNVVMIIKRRKEDA